MTEREHGRGEGREPLDEEAAWAQIVAGYDQEGRSPAEPRLPAEERRSEAGADGPDAPGGKDDADDRSGGDLLEKRPQSDGDGEDREAGPESGDKQPDGGKPGEAKPDGEEIRTFTVYPVLKGPRDWKPAESEEDDHFVPPEPPPLPKLDTTAKFAWLAVLGGPALLFGAVIFQIPMNWWMITLGIGGFLGGFGTLIARMRDDEDDDGFEDPGRGAVV